MSRNTLEVLNITGTHSTKEILDTMVKVQLDATNPKVFLGIIETLRRVGVNKPNSNKIFQTCHILCKGGEYYIAHFKHLFMLDGRYNGFQREDVLRLNRVVKLLEEWNMIKVIDPTQMTEWAAMSTVKVVKHSDIKNWELVPKYHITTKKEKELNNLYRDWK